MDESLSQNGSSQNNGNRGSSTQSGDKISDDNNGKSNATQYTIPGILHFIEHEWTRFELERSQWDVDRAELQVSFSFLSTFLQKSSCIIKNIQQDKIKSMFSPTMFSCTVCLQTNYLTIF